MQIEGMKAELEQLKQQLKTKNEEIRNLKAAETNIQR